MKIICFICMLLMYALGMFEIIDINKAIMTMIYVLSVYILNKEE